MVNEAREARTLGLWRRVAIARPNLMQGEWGRLTSSYCFARYTKNIAKGSEGVMAKVGIAVLSEWNVYVFIIYVPSAIESKLKLGDGLNHVTVCLDV